MAGRIVVAGSVASLSMLLVSCFGGGGDGGGGGGGGGAACAGFERSLRTCGLLSAGDFHCSEPDDDDERCLARCVIGASCNELELFVCDDIDSAEEARLVAPSLASCIEACEPPDFVCPSGEPIPGGWVCDGDNDCGDFADEQDCSSEDSDAFDCGGGNTVPQSYTCDGYADCDGGADEEGCPTFTCGNGDEIPDDYRCDDEPDCADASDETDCAQLMCGGASSSDSSSQQSSAP